MMTAARRGGRGAGGAESSAFAFFWFAPHFGQIASGRPRL